MVVVLVQNLGGDVVRSSKLLIEVTVGVIDQGGTEINDLDLIEFFVGLEQDVLRLEISMDNIGLVAVVDARKHLLHEHSGVTLREFSTSQDFVEQLTALADPTAKMIG